MIKSNWKVNTLISFLLVASISACSTKKQFEIQPEEKKVKIPAAYTRPCIIPQFYGEFYSDAIKHIEILKFALKACDGKIKLIKEWDDKHNGSITEYYYLGD